ncbi:hypothetical protein JCM8202v2_002819 [Rhodotorula sphaerocarpa]
MTAPIEAWTAEQVRQARSAVFSDDPDLPFALPWHSDYAAELCGGQFYSENVDNFAPSGLKTVAGLDISFRIAEGNEGIAVLSLLSFPDLRVDLSSTPYVHSYLSFRESDIYVSLLQDLRKTHPHEPAPQLLFVDGNGRWHPRQAGSAVAVGVKTGLPTIGVAKEYHPLFLAESGASPPLPGTATTDRSKCAEADKMVPTDYLASQKGMRKACQALLRRRGDWLALPGPAATPQKPEPLASEPWGAALLSSPARGALNPVFVSPGHRLSLQTCVRLVLACCQNGKTPEPIRSADLFGTESLVSGHMDRFCG